MPKFNKSGFTLIELLITLSIIAVLATIGLITYGTLQKNSRDAKRQSDFKTLQSALQQYKADQHFYPPGETANTYTGFDGQQITDAFGRPSAPVTKIYLNQSPKEAIPENSTYIYAPTPFQDFVPPGEECLPSQPNNCTGYCICGKSEGPPPETPTNCAFLLEEDYNFCVSSP